MSNKKENSTEIDVTTEKTAPVLYPDGGEITFIMPDTNTLGKLKKAKRGVNLTAKYMRVRDWEDKKGEALVFFFYGFKSATDSKGEPFSLARLIDANGNHYVSAPTILTQSLASLPIGQGVEITCTDVKKNNSGGETPYFDVVRLEVNLFGNND